VDEDVEVYWEVWEYVGPSGGANEFVVRQHMAFSLGDGTASSTSAAVTGVDDIADCVPFIAGLSHDGTGLTWDQVNATAKMVTDSGTKVTVDVDDGTGTALVYVELVEFTGGNWTVQNSIEHDQASSFATETETITAVSAWTNAFIEHQWRGVQVTQNRITGICWPGSTTSAVRFWAHASQYCMAHVVENSEISVEHLDTVAGGATDHPAGSASPQTVTTALAAVPDLRHAAVIAGSQTSAGNTDYPQAFWNYQITDRDELTWWRARHGASSDWSAQIIDFQNGQDPNTKQDTVYLAKSTDGSVADLIVDLSQEDTDISNQTTFGRESSSSRCNISSPRSLEAEIEFSSGETGTILWHGEDTSNETFRLYITAGSGAEPVSESNDSGTAIDGGNLTLNKPTGTAEDDGLFACLSCHGATIDTLSGWTRLFDVTTGAHHAVFDYKVAGGSEPSTYTWTLTGSTTDDATAGGIDRVSGIDTADPIDVSASTTTASNTSHLCPTVTTTVDNCHVLRAIAYDNDPTSSWASATEIWDVQAVDTNEVAAAMATESQASAGATGTETVTSSWAAASESFTVAVKPSVEKLRLAQDGADVATCDLPTSMTNAALFVRASTYNNPDTTGAGDAVITEMSAYSTRSITDGSEWQSSTATHAIAAGAASDEFEVLAQDGADVPDFTTKMVRVGRSFHTATEWAHDWFLNRTTPIVSADARVEQYVPTKSSGFGDNGYFAGPVLALAGSAARRMDLRLASPLVNEVYFDLVTMDQANAPNEFEILPPGETSGWTSKLEYSIWTPVPPVVNSCKVRVFVKLWESGGGSPNELDVRCYSATREPVIGGLVTPGNPVVPLDAPYSSAATTADDTSSGVGHWLDLGLMRIASHSDESLFFLAFQINNGAAESGKTTQFQIKAWTVEPVIDIPTNNRLPDGIGFGG